MSSVNEIILKNLHEKKLKNLELAGLLDITPRTLENRWKNPNNWTLIQLKQLCEILELSNEDIISVIKY